MVDPRKEKNAIREARRLGITTIALIDTDCDPDDVDLPIPGNDDGIRSIELVLQVLADAVLAGKSTASVRPTGRGPRSPRSAEHQRAGGGRRGSGRIDAGRLSRRHGSDHARRAGNRCGIRLQACSQA